MGREGTTGYMKMIQRESTPKYRYLALSRDERVKPHKKGSYPKRGIFLANLGPIIDLGPPDKSRKRIADTETKKFKGREKEIAMELIMLGFYHAGDGLFVKDNRWYVDLASKEVKRKQKSYPKDTRVPFKR